MYPIKDDKIRINYRNKIDGLLLLDSIYDNWNQILHSNGSAWSKDS